MNRNLSTQLVSLLAMAVAVPLMAANPPAVGDKAPDFALSSISGKTVRLSEVTAQGPTVLVVLRGYPGYQCPFCNRQAQDYIKNAQGFTAAGARVVMVYPGSAKDLATHAQEFMANKTFPVNFELLLDPDYEFTNLYGLRWNAPQETAYPSTFLLDHHGSVFFAKVSKEHGGRSTAAEVQEALKQHASSEMMKGH